MFRLAAFERSEWPQPDTSQLAKLEEVYERIYWRHVGDKRMHNYCRIFENLASWMDLKYGS